ncbi:hypothetical protein WME99_36545 [Sorangium sp. So ce136]|uniref:hypothetical protein n=1 Tax=Sorangium sp. So ce136 TaxID=3133284 RepID=UPI003F00CB7F
MRLHATSTVSAASSYPPGARRGVRRRALLSAALTGSLVATAATPAGAEEQAITVRLLPRTNPASRTIELLPDRMIPASKAFTVVVPTVTAHEEGTLDVWPRVETEGCKTVPARLPRRAQHHTLAMRMTGADPERSLQATVPPLEIGATFCFHVLRTIRPAGNEAQQVNRIAADNVEQHIAGTRILTVNGIRGAFGTGIRDATTEIYPAATVAEVNAAVRRAMSHLIPSGTVEAYIAAETLVEAPDPNNQRAEREKRRDEAKKDLRKAIEESVVNAISKLHIREQITLSSRPDAGTTPEAGNYVALDAGVVLAAPMRGGDGPNFWVVPYFGVNFYAVPVDRTIPVNDLAGNPVWQRLSATLGVSLTEPSLPGRATRGILFKRYPMAALGYRLTHFVRVTAGASFYEVADRNPTSNEYHFAVAPFAGASLDIDVIHMIREAFIKL